MPPPPRPSVFPRVLLLFYFKTRHVSFIVRCFKYLSPNKSDGKTLWVLGAPIKIFSLRPSKVETVVRILTGVGVG